VNPLARELVFKLVYYGPGLGGKTTTLQHIHTTSKPEHRGKMVSLATPVDRTLYFDFLPVRIPNVRGMGVRLQLFTVPGQVYYNATRKLVLTGADGVVMVLDSQRVRMDANLESWDNLRENLREHGRTLGELPHVFQYNKRDLAELASVEELQDKFNELGVPAFDTVATVGQGVYEALEAVTRLVLEDFERRIPAGPGRAPQQLELPEEGLAAALRRSEQPAVPSIAEPEPMPRAPSVPPDEGSEPPPTAVSQPPPEPTPPASASDLSTAPAAAEPAESQSGPAVSSERAQPVPTPVAPSPEPAGQPALELPASLSFAPLWPDPERAVVLELQEALCVGDYEGAVLRAEQLVARVLAAVASMLGASPEAPRDPAVVALLLGLEPRRYLEFRGLVRATRSGGAVSHVAALSAYAFAIETRLARLRLLGHGPHRAPGGAAE
jgi:signal recognition particle receptor subunit beta